MKPIWTYPLAWCAVVVVALLLAFGAPRYHHAVGRLPAEVGVQLERVPARATEPDGRMLALVTFQRDQRAVAETWIRGLNLHEGSVMWVRMPVVNDPGEPGLRAQAEGRLLARYPSPHERNNLLPVFTNRATFLQLARLSDSEQPWVLVINRRGDILARVAGPYDPDKAATLLDTLKMLEL